MTSLSRKPIGEVIATWEGWQLSGKDDPKGAPWRRIKLVHLSAPRFVLKKRAYHLAWNGERLAGHRDYRLLAEHQPALLAFVLQSLRGNP